MPGGPFYTFLPKGGGTLAFPAFLAKIITLRHLGGISPPPLPSGVTGSFPQVAILWEKVKF